MILKLTEKWFNVEANRAHFTSHQTLLAFLKKCGYPAGELGLLMFKADLHESPLEKSMKDKILCVLKETPKVKPKYSITIMGDAKASLNRFALTSIDGTPFMYGRFMESPRAAIDSSAQSWAETLAFVYAVRLVRDLCYFAKIKFSDIKLTYVTDSKDLERAGCCRDGSIRPFMVENILKEIPIQAEFIWIRGVDNHADQYTLEYSEAYHPQYEKIKPFLVKTSKK